MLWHKGQALTHLAWPQHTSSGAGILTPQNRAGSWVKVVAVPTASRGRRHMESSWRHIAAGPRAMAPSPFLWVSDDALTDGFGKSPAGLRHGVMEGPLLGSVAIARSSLCLPDHLHQVQVQESTCWVQHFICAGKPGWCFEAHGNAPCRYSYRGKNFRKKLLQKWSRRQNVHMNQ